MNLHSALRSFLIVLACATFARAEEPQPVIIGVMDPLAAPLSCDCVKGYAQRDYNKLGAHLQQRLGRPVRVAYAEELGRIVRAEAARGPVQFVIGKQSVVKFDAADLRLGVRPLCLLTDQTGSTSVHGLFVVRKDDPAAKLEDLSGYTILFGTADADEKHAAALAAMRQAGLAVPEKPQTRAGCSDAAVEVCESAAPMAGVISSYATATLEGCGTIEKGALRVVGKTAPVPFVTVFATEAADDTLVAQVRAELLAAKDEALLGAIESQRGFVPMPEKKATAPAAVAPAEAAPAASLKPSADDWPGWRGAKRDAVVAWLPDALPAEAAWRWRQPLGGQGLGGLAVAAGRVIVPDRDALDTKDVFRCFDAESGKPLWQFEYPATGKLDYGNSPRATPLIVGGKVYTLGAFGDLYCLSLADGRVLWKKNLISEFDARLVTWGMCASPLLVDGKLIVNPGAPAASIVALDARTGEPVWKALGGPAAYSSFILARLGGVEQIVGYDAIGLTGLHPQTGKRLWTLLPRRQGDFNVPTPIELDGRLLVTTENNGTRIYDFDQRGSIVPKALAQHDDLAPDSSTPVVTGGRVLGCWNALFCLGAKDLKPIWVLEDEAFQDYASLIAAPGKVLLTTAGGELILADASGDEGRILSRLRIAPENTDVIAHPAVAGRRIYLRVGQEVACLPLQ